MADKKLVVKVAGKQITLPAKKTEPTTGRPEIVVIEKNPFVSAKAVARRVKALFYGPTGTRKTRTALHFPKPAVADLEDGTKWYADEFTFDVLPAIPNFAAYVSVINWLAKGDHPYLTLVTDPSTILWEMLQKQWSDTFLTRNIGGKGFKYDFYNMQPGDWKHVKAEWKDVMMMLMALDMHVIFTARSADLFADGEMMRKIGERPDTEKNVRYWFDIVLRLDNNDKGGTIATVEKDRTGKLPIVPFALSYDAIEAAFGKEYLNREIDKSLMPSPLPEEEEPTKVEITMEETPEPPDPSEEEIAADQPAAETPTVEAELPKEEGQLCKGCDTKHEKLSFSKEHGLLCKECMKEAKKPAGSTGKPIKVVIKKDKTKETKKKVVKPQAEFCTAQQEKDIREFCETLEISEQRMFKSLAAYGATNFKTLTKEKAEKVIASLEKKLKEKR